MPGQRIGSAIAAVFGLIYVLLNTEPLATTWMLTLRVLAAIACISVLVAILRHRSQSHRRDEPQQSVFTRGYWWVVVAEVLAIFAGTRLLSGPLGVPQAGVAWVSVVVGVHFFALAVLFRQPFFHWLGGAITACGITGLLLAATGAGDRSIDLVAGVLPGVLLLGFGWWGATRNADGVRLRLSQVSDVKQ